MHGRPIPLIELRSVDRHFGPRAALSAVDLAVGSGEIHGLIGPRSAGKTTLLRVLAGALAPSAGLVWVPARTALVSADDADALSPIEARLNPGTRRRITLARALAGAPDVLLVDEPVESVDADTAAATRALVARHAARGGTVIWAARRLDDLHDLAAGVTLLVDGRVRFSGTVEALALRARAGSVEPLAAAA